MNLSLIATQITVQETTETVTETHSESQQTVEQVTQQQTTMESKTTETEESSYHLSSDEIDEYEESRAKFRELWERKRENVRKFLKEFSFLFVP